MIGGTWFPLHVDIVTSDDFKDRTPTEKLYFFLVTSEFNARDRFYMSDLEAAVRIGAKEITARKARRTFQKLGLIETKLGFKGPNGRGVATTYCDVKGAKVDKKSGRQFVRQQRYMFNSLLDCVRDGIFKPVDVVVYVYLNYIRQKHNITKLSKGWLKELTGIPQADKSVKKLYDRYTFSGGNTLFDYTDLYQHLKISGWREAVPPEKSEDNAALAVRYEKEIAQKVQDIREEKKHREIEQDTAKGILRHPEQLPVWFNVMYEDKYNKKPSHFDYQEEELIELGEKRGVKVIADALISYFAADVVPNPTNAKYRNLTRFLRVYEQFLPDQQTG